MNKKELGKWGEQIAAKFLRENGFCVLESNYKCPLGEADLIVSKKDTVIFVEVKTRGSLKYGLPSEAVTNQKKAKYYHIASYYINYKKLVNKNLRFDVIEVFLKHDGTFNINHIPNAF